MSFDHLSLAEDLLQSASPSDSWFRNLGLAEQTEVRSSFDTPTPIQSVGWKPRIWEVQCGVCVVNMAQKGPVRSGWPTALSGRDMVGIAQTGSGEAGKTLYLP